MQDIFNKNAIKIQDVESILNKIKKLETVFNDGDLAEILNTNANNIYSWKHRNQIPNKILLEYCKNAGINYNWLVYDEGVKEVPDSFDAPRSTEKIPIISPIDAGKGIMLNDDYQFDEWVSCPPGLQGHKPFAMRIDEWANSMMPLLRPGMLVIASQTTEATNGDIAVVHCKECDKVCCKQVFYENGTVRLHSFNPDYEDEIKSNDDLVYIYPIIWTRRAK